MIKRLPFVIGLLLILYSSCRSAKIQSSQREEGTTRVKIDTLPTDSTLLFKVNRITTQASWAHALPFYCTHIIELQRSDSLFFVLSKGYPPSTKSIKLTDKQETKSPYFKIQEGGFYKLNLKPLYTKAELNRMENNPNYISDNGEKTYFVDFKDHTIDLSWYQLNNLYTTDNLNDLYYIP